MKYETVDDENFAKLTSKVVSARIDYMLSKKGGTNEISNDDILADT